MLLKTTHTTRLTYSALIGETVMELRMAPRHETGQHRLSFDLAIGPATRVRSYFDWLGNTVHTFSIVGRHRNVEISAISVVETHAPPVTLEALDDTWPLSSSLDYTLGDYLRFDETICECPGLDELVAQVRPIGSVRLEQVARNLMDLISVRFIYEKGSTDAASTLAHVLTLRRGVCQDFTHLMMALARKLGVPARYVSGYVFPLGKTLHEIAESHAWCELYFPSAGWVAFDPTNNTVTGENFVKVAVGRSYRDVPPHKGVYFGAARETMEVHVHCEQLPEVPGRLVGERSSSIDIPVYHSEPLPLLSWTLDERMQQQQQQQQSVSEGSAAR